MRLLFVIDNLSTGGAQRQMVNLALGLRGRGHDISFFCYARGDLLAEPLRAAGIPIDTHLKRSRFSPSVIRALRGQIRASKPDVVVSFLTTPNFYAIAATRLLAAVKPLGACRPLLVISERFYDPPEGVGWRQELIRQFYRLADCLTVNSHHQRINFCEKYPWLRDCTYTIYNGYDLAAFHPPEAEPCNDPLKLLSVASVSPYKNGLCLVRTLSILSTDYGLRPHVSWVGERVMSSDRLQYLRRMQQEIAERGLTSQWTWLDPRPDIVALMHRHDLLVHPSYGEGLPNVVCEALACGRPVIVSHTLDHPRLVEHGLSGYLYDWRDPASLAHFIARFHALTPVQRKSMGSHGRRFAEQNLSLSRLADEYEDLLYSL